MPRSSRCDILTAFLAKDFSPQSALDPRSSTISRSSRVVREEIINAGGVPKRERVSHVFMKKALAMIPMPYLVRRTLRPFLLP